MPLTSAKTTCKEHVGPITFFFRDEKVLACLIWDGEGGGVVGLARCLSLSRVSGEDGGEVGWGEVWREVG